MTSTGLEDKKSSGGRRRLPRFDPAAALGRVIGSAPAAVQLAVAATGAYSIAHFALGHAFPILAITITLTSLGFVRDARPIRVLETAFGLSVGVALSELFLLLIGTGPIQLGFVMLVTLLVARFLSKNPAIAVTAAVQAALVLLLTAPAGGPFVRSIDALIGGVVALVATAVIPRDPRRAAFREARRLFSECSEALAALVSALRLADVTGADRTLARLRKTQPLIDDWSSSLDSAVAVARISPFFHRFLPELVAQQRVLRGMDLVTRNLRIITRRIDFLIRDGKPRLQLAELLSAVSGGLNLLGQGLRDPSMFGLARQDMILVAMRLDPRVIVPQGTVNDVMIVMLLRPLLVDLLTATGMPESEARTLLPKVSGPETGAIVIAQDVDDH